MASSSVRKQSRAANAQRQAARRAELQRKIEAMTAHRQSRREIRNNYRTSNEVTTTAPAKTDSVQLSAKAQQAEPNPFEGFATSSRSVTVRPGDTLSELLMAQGFPSSEIYGADGALAQVMKDQESQPHLP